MQAQWCLSLHIPAHGKYFHIYIINKYIIFISDLPNCSVGIKEPPVFGDHRKDWCKKGNFWQWSIRKLGVKHRTTGGVAGSLFISSNYYSLLAFILTYTHFCSTWVTKIGHDSLNEDQYVHEILNTFIFQLQDTSQDTLEFNCLFIHSCITFSLLVMLWTIQPLLLLSFEIQKSLPSEINVFLLSS